MAMLKNLAFLQKLLKDWVRVLGRQDLFQGLVTTNVTLTLATCKNDPQKPGDSLIKIGIVKAEILVILSLWWWVVVSSVIFEGAAFL